MDTALEDLSIAEIGRRLRARSLTSEALTRHLLARIRKIEPSVQAFITLTEERALDDAMRADRELAAGHDRGPFHGIPYGLKDLFDTKGIRTTCHSKLRLDHVPEADSLVEEKLHAAGGVLLGKLAMNEFAHGGPSFDLPFPPARNPWNTEHYPGGSSSGSGAAVAARMMRVAMGSDTGGSIRSPAALCGVVGLKPTYGRVSRRGAFPLSYSLDHCGPLATTVEEATIALQVIAGYDRLDPASADEPVPDFFSGMNAGVRGLRIGLPRHFFSQGGGMSPEVIAAIDRVAGALRDAGAIVEDVTLPDFGLFVACGQVILAAEAYAIHAADLRARPQDFGKITMQKNLMGVFVSGADLVQAHRVRRHLCDAVDAVMQRYDALIAANVLATAAPIRNPRPSSWMASQNLTFNVTGMPALAVPTGLAEDGLPMSITVAGRAFDEATVLRIGRTIEVVSGWEKVRLPEVG
jgi:aspartyl-tRNA(Asn)/glutamyl-tRNA(Gln) amidotransferase subunit A